MANFGLFAVLVLCFLAAAQAAVTTSCKLKWKNPIHNGVTTIYVGTTCTWTWLDDLGHCVDFAGKLPTGEVLSGSGSTFSQKFLKVGVYKYKCCLHLSQMDGTINVVAKPATAPCVPKCNGRCYGPNGCPKGVCPFPKRPLNTIKKCTACCAQKVKRSRCLCYRACRGIKPTALRC